MAKRPESNSKEDLVYTGVKVREDDYAEAQIKSHEAKMANTNDAWRDFHLWLDLLAVKKYGLVQRTGRYGLTIKGEFTHTLDSIPRAHTGDMAPPPPSAEDLSDPITDSDMSECDR